MARGAVSAVGSHVLNLLLEWAQSVKVSKNRPESIETTGANTRVRVVARSPIRSGISELQ
jgi:hypothetical protein